MVSILLATSIWHLHQLVTLNLVMPSNQCRAAARCSPRLVACASDQSVAAMQLQTFKSPNGRNVTTSPKIKDPIAFLSTALNDTNEPAGSTTDDVALIWLNNQSRIQEVHYVTEIAMQYWLDLNLLEWQN